MKFKLLAVIGILALSSGCATQAKRQYQQMHNHATNTSSAYTDCVEKLNSTEPMMLISKRFIIDNDDPKAFEKMLIDEYASETEKNALIAISPYLQECQTIALEGYSKVHPDFVTLLANRYAKLDNLRLKVFKDEITVGMANEQLRQLDIDSKKEFNQIAHRITSQLESAHQVEIQQRQVAGQAFSQTLNRSIQQYQANMNQIYQQQMELYRQKPTFNCQTNYVGYSSYMTCR